MRYIYSELFHSWWGVEIVHANTTCFFVSSIELENRERKTQDFHITYSPSHLVFLSTFKQNNKSGNSPKKKKKKKKK